MLSTCIVPKIVPVPKTLRFALKTDVLVASIEETINLFEIFVVGTGVDVYVIPVKLILFVST